MKILLITDYGEPHGGSEVNTLAIRSELRKRGHDARLFSSNARLGSYAIDSDYTCFGTETRLRTIVQTANPWAFIKLRQVLDQFNPDVVHVRTFMLQLSPLILPLIKKYPSIYHIVLYKALCPMGNKMLPTGDICRVSSGLDCLHHRCLPLRGWLPLMLQLFLWRRWRSCFSVLLTPSEALKHVLEREGIKPVEVIWNGFPAVSAEPSLAPVPTVAFAGRLVFEKGVDLLIEAFSQVVKTITDARLIVAGSGPERVRLEEIAARLGIASSVTFTGHIPRAEMERLFAGAWVQVVPSRWVEPFGNVAAEGMMRGTAVVASRTGGFPEFIKDGENGFLVPRGDAKELAATLNRLMADRNLAERIGRAGRKFALSNLTIERCVDKILGVYEQILGNS
jgi:glycosyltransferase involved in cell wall biosynthesis